MNKRGRKPELFPEEVIQKIINDFLIGHDHYKKIKYKEIYNFALENLKEYELIKPLSEDYWRKEGRQGRQFVDKHNQKVIPSNISNKKFKIVDTSDVIDKFSKDSQQIKKQIISVLRTNETGYLKVLELYNQNLDKTNAMKNEMHILNEKIMNLNEKLKTYEQILFQLADRSSSNKIPIKNVITTGSSRTKIVQELFDNLFSDDPHKPYFNIKEDKQLKDDIIIDFNKKKNKFLEELDL